mgnify:CR=1 FL=1
MSREGDREGLTHKVTIGGFAGHLTANVDENGDLAEVFIHGFGSFGSTHRGWTDSFGIMLSLGIRHGDLSIERLRERFATIKFEPNGATDNPDIPTCESIPDYIF